jgi:putative mRNA 3-end processing factor
LVIAPPSVIGSLWLRQFREISLGVASGWMTLRGSRRRKNADRGFVLSDHADWKGLNAAVHGTGAEKVIATHGYSDIFSQWLRQQGLEAAAEKTAFEGELLDPAQMEEGEKEE